MCACGTAAETGLERLLSGERQLDPGPCGPNNVLPSVAGQSPGG